MASRISARRGTRVLAAATIAFGLLGCGDDDGSDEAAPETTSTTGSELDATTTTELTVTAEEVELDVPRSVVYANLEVTVHSVTVSNATPGTYLDEEPAPGDQSYAFVETTIEAELADPGDRLAVEDVELEPASGAPIDAEGVDFGSGVTIEPGVANELTLAFPVDEASDLDGAELVIGEQGRVPARLPLDGPVEEDPYPVEIEVSGSGTVDYEGGCDNATGTFEVVGAEVDLDAGADHGDEAIEPNQSKRAVDGERWLRVRVQTVATAGTCGGTIVDDAAFRLLVDGLPTATLNRDNELLDNGAGTEFVWGWTVPVDAELVLQVGLVDGATVEVPIDLPADLP